MTNAERREALNRARTMAYEYAKIADRHYGETSEDGPEVALAAMWARVAEAMKDGDPVHDGPDGRPGPTVLTREGSPLSEFTRALGNPAL